ncbi:DUF3224 domain-containing protein [Saccharothrix longispora]|uniref:DUF3224 domain-containing protein n=1 Tax=Saccharothrix longispora TaxID=33920 RepID=UPI0028FD6714|nr:DUF3224 domain-containing protein [Saccharothrix longispora]MDU0291025.1 DUF3224 domain-containing protein [Saccharothrix longispora]
MGFTATGDLLLRSWDETTFSEEDGIKLTRSTIRYVFEGDVEGSGLKEYVMAYRSDESTTFVGLEHVVGRIGDRKGTFVLHHTGELDGEQATVEFTVVPGSGTGELAGLTGKGGFVAKHSDSGNAAYRFDYDFE